MPVGMTMGTRNANLDWPGKVRDMLDTNLNHTYMQLGEGKVQVYYYHTQLNNKYTRLNMVFLVPGPVEILAITTKFLLYWLQLENEIQRCTLIK